MNKNQLTIEDILKEEDLVNDMKKNSCSQFYSIFSNEIIRKLIDYSTKMPETNDIDRGYKFPYFSCEILSSDSGIVMDLLMHTINLEIEQSDEDNDSNESEEDDEEDEEDENKKKGEELSPTLVNKEDIMKDDSELAEEAKDEIKSEAKLVEEVKVKPVPEAEIETDKDNQLIEEKKEESEVIQEEAKPLEEIQPEVEENKTENKEDEVDNYTYSDDEETKRRKREKANRLKQKKFKVVYENLDYFFDFLLTPTHDDNHVLIGYFYKILLNLFEKKGDVIINYIFELRPEILGYFIKHLNRRLIADCVSRILNYTDNNNSIFLNEKKIQFLTQIIQELHETKDEESYEYICYALITSISNRQFFPLLMSNSMLVQLLFSALYKDMMNNEHIIQSLLLLMIKINENILKSFNGLITPDRAPPEIEQMNMNFFDQMNSDEDKKGSWFLGATEEENEKNLQLALRNIFETLKENNFMVFNDLDKFNKPNIKETTYENEQKVLGMKKLVQVEYFRTLIDIFINSYFKKYYKEDIDELFKSAIDTNVFKNLIDILFMFEFNNMYQIIFGQILSVLLNEHTPEILIIHFFKDLKLVERMQNHLLYNRVLTFSSGNTINSPLFAFEVNFICDLGNSSNIYIRALIDEDKELNTFFTIFTTDLVNIYKGKLCYSEEGNAYSNYQFSSQTNQSNEKTIELSLNSMIKENKDIYDTYKNGGNYEELLEEKHKREENFKKKNENLNNLSVDENNVFGSKDEHGIEGEEEERNNYDDEFKVELLQEKDEFYDNNYWKSEISEENDFLKDLE